MQRQFVNEYLKCFNASKAARLAGYSDKTSHVAGSRLLSNVNVSNVIQRRFCENAMDSDEVLHHLTELARGDLTDVIDRFGNPDLDKAIEYGSTGLLKKVKSRTIISIKNDGEEESETHITEVEIHDRLKALGLLAKYHGLLIQRIKVEDWRTKAIDDVRSGRLTIEQVIEAFGSKEDVIKAFGNVDLVAQLFARASSRISAD